MKTDWTPLRKTLAEFRAQNVSLDFWWRDDDAVRPTSALDQLETMAQSLGVKTHIAVIPKLAEFSLVDRVRSSSTLIPLVHGWQHISHEPFGQKKAEFGRPRAKAVAEIHHAVEHLKTLFPDQLLPVFVPPWNRIHDCYMPHLTRAGIQIISTFAPRTAAFRAQGLQQINTHIDPIDWKGTRDLLGPDLQLDRLNTHLKARLSGQGDNAEPLGYLTHHLIHSPATWVFSERLVKELLDGGASPITLSTDRKVKP